MGTVRRIAPAAGDLTLGQAVDAYLVTFRGAKQTSTRRTYGRILRRVVTEFGTETAPDEVDAARFAEWFGAQWAGRAPSTWNVSLDAVAVLTARLLPAPGISQIAQELAWIAACCRSLLGKVLLGLLVVAGRRIRVRRVDEVDHPGCEWLRRQQAKRLPGDTVLEKPQP